MTIKLIAGGPRRLTALSIGAVLSLSAAGCGYSEDEWQAKLREIEGLNNSLAAERSQHNKTKSELEEARKRTKKLEDDLREAGVNLSNVNAKMEETERALEDYRKRAEQLEQIKKRFEALRAKLQDLTRLGLKVTVRNNRMVVQLPGDVLFDSGRETLKKEGEDILKKVADVVRNDPGLSARSYQVAGHTDNAPLQGGRFKDNWGLSVMRAREVLAFLIAPADKGGGLPAKRWSASGYGDTDPVADNATPEGKQANRRCEIVVLPNVEEMLDLRQLTQ